MIAARFECNGLRIAAAEIDVMKRTTVTIFEILEKFWATQNCVLVDMKIEFGVNTEGKYIVP